MEHIYKDYRYTAVDANGQLWKYNGIPELTNNGVWVAPGLSKGVFIEQQPVPMDWQNTLVDRHAQLFENVPKSMQFCTITHSGHPFYTDVEPQGLFDGIFTIERPDTFAEDVLCNCPYCQGMRIGSDTTVDDLIEAVRKSLAVALGITDEQLLAQLTPTPEETGLRARASAFAKQPFDEMECLDAIAAIFSGTKVSFESSTVGDVNHTVASVEIPEFLKKGSKLFDDDGLYIQQFGRGARPDHGDMSAEFDMANHAIKLETALNERAEQCKQLEKELIATNEKYVAAVNQSLDFKMAVDNKQITIDNLRTELNTTRLARDRHHRKVCELQKLNSERVDQIAYVNIENARITKRVQELEGQIVGLNRKVVGYREENDRLLEMCDNAALKLNNVREAINK